MAEKLDMKLFGSTCTRNDYFMEQAAKAADELGLEYTIEKITNEAIIEANGLRVNCMYAYCPGCKAMHVELTEGSSEKFTPALMINGELRVYNYYPGKEALSKILSEYI